MGEKLLYILATEENSTENFQPIFKSQMWLPEDFKSSERILA